MAYLLVLIGMACIAASLAHGYVAQTRLIAPAQFPNRRSQGMMTMLLQYSTVTWVAIGAFIAASPWLLDQQARSWAVPLACLPILYGVVGNAVVSRGRHYGWVLFAVIIAAAAAAANI